METSYAKPVLKRTLSSHHILASMFEMFNSQQTTIEAGFSSSPVWGGWTRWMIIRPHATCMDLDHLSLLTITCDNDGKVSTVISPIKMEVVI